MNIEVDHETLDELEHAFKFNDAVLRHLIVAMDEAVVAPSPMMKEEKSRSLTGERRSSDRGERGDRPERGERRPRRAPGRTPRRRSTRSGARAGVNRACPPTARPQPADARRDARSTRPLRYTPAGIPALDCTLRHASGRPRRAASGRSNASCTRWRSPRWRRRWRRCRPDRPLRCEGFLARR